MTDLFLLMVFSYAFGVVAALLGGRGHLGRGLVALGAVIGAGAGLVLGMRVLLSGIPFTLSNK